MCTSKTWFYFWSQWLQFLAGYSSFEWLKLTHVTNWASQCIAAKIDCDSRWILWNVN